MTSLALVLVSALLVGAFVRGCRRRPWVVGWRAAAFAAGLAAVAVAVSPWFDRAADASFAAHMTQHLVFIAVGAPLLVLSDPWPSVIAGLPRWLRAPIVALRREARLPSNEPVGPWPRFVVHVGVVFAFHSPALFDAALANPSLHALEHLLFLSTAVWFWEPVLTRRGIRRVGEGIGVAYVLAAGVAWSGLGALLTFSSQPWYPSYVALLAHDRAVADQQLAGLLMWLPPGLLYLGVAFVLLWRVLERLEPSGAAPRGVSPTVRPRVAPVSPTPLVGTHSIGGVDEA